MSELKLIALTNNGPLLYTLDCSNTNEQVEQLKRDEDFPSYPKAEIAKFSPKTGRLLAIVDIFGIHILDIQEKALIHFIEKKGITSLEWSP